MNERRQPPRTGEHLGSAIVGQDTSDTEAMLAPEWSVTDASGQVLSKQQVLDETLGISDRSIDSMTIDDVRVLLFGNAAVATGRTRAIGSYRGASSSVVLRFTDVFIRRNGRWQVVVSHGSIVSQ